MKNRITHPQEIIVWNIIPFIRREIALEMKKQGMEQKKIASLLKVTEPAISQYINDKRAQKKFYLGHKFKKEILKSTQNIIKNKTPMLYEIQRLINIDEIKSLICSIHKKEFGASKDCNLCVIGVK